MKILLIDDHALVRAGVRLLLSQINPAAECQEYAHIDEAQACLDEVNGEDVIFLDLYLPNVSGLKVLSDLKERKPATPIIVLSADDRTSTVRASLDAGASGFVSKAADPTVLETALRDVVNGRLFIPPEAISGGIFPEGSPIHALLGAPPMTPRQREVLDCLLRGMANKAICKRLNLSDATARQHTQALLRSFNVQSRSQIVVEAMKFGIGIQRS